MKNLVRGVAVMSIISLFVVIIYAGTSTETALSIANDSQDTLNKKESSENVITETITAEPAAAPTPNTEKPAETEVKKESDTKTAEPESASDKEKSPKLVEKTVSSKAVGRSRGSFTATAYCLRGRTATGAGVRKGIIAADPRVLRLGSKVNLTAGGYSGNYVVADTGGKIKGKRIDIWMASCAEARRFGRRTVSISSLE